ncbi:hypothetical protein LCGC14_2828460 [marine sediment metagenome]|uniref:Uncharacterized protein n=1 Tax=marine sediment metagenome TaxID=412755 RepID=A0A0F9B5Y5_9ZZZZ
MSEASREMTLLEIVENLPPFHRARQEYAKLCRSGLRFRKLVYVLAELFSEYGNQGLWWLDNLEGDTEEVMGKDWIEEVLGKDWSRVEKTLGKN